MRLRFMFPFGIVLLLLVVFPVAGCVEAPGIAWSKTYGGKNSEGAYALVETSDGGFAMAGYTSSIYSGPYVLLVRTSPESRPPTVSIISPENRTYTANSVPLTFTVNKPAKWMAYSLDGKANVTVAGNTTLNELPNGSHNITVYATDLEGIPQPPEPYTSP